MNSSCLQPILSKTSKEVFAVGFPEPTDEEDMAKPPADVACSEASAGASAQANRIASSGHVNAQRWLFSTLLLRIPEANSMQFKQYSISTKCAANTIAQKTLKVKVVDF